MEKSYYDYLYDFCEKKIHNRKIVICTNCTNGKTCDDEELYIVFKNRGGVEPSRTYINKESDIAQILGKQKDFYLIINEKYSGQLCDQLKRYGYLEIRDYIFTTPKLTVVSGSIPYYEDEKGNVIKNLPMNLMVKLRGYGSIIEFGENVQFGKDCNMQVFSFAEFKCSSNAVFQEDVFIDLSNVSKTEIGKSLFRKGGVIGCGAWGKLHIGENSTYGIGNELIASAHYSLYIGNDVMTSRRVAIRSGDGHAIFDVDTGKRKNYNLKDISRNHVHIGNHVWFGYESMLLNFSKVGSGCIIGARSLVKGVYPNNCVIAGSIARIVKKNTAWSRSAIEDDMIRGCGNSYAISTVDVKRFSEVKRKQSEINNLQLYFKELSKLQQYIAIIAVKDTPGHKFKLSEREALQLVNLRGELIDKHWCGYIAIIEDNKVIYENNSKQDVSIQTEHEVSGINIDVLSAPLHAGNVARILINEQDYSPNLRGLNIVLYDKESNQIFDAVCFDTHMLNIPCHRKIYLC